MRDLFCYYNEDEKPKEKEENCPGYVVYNMEE
jgi:hypothetical protein